MNTNTLSCATPMRLFCFQTDFNAAVVIPPAQGRRAFVSEPSFDPSSGISAADALCMQDAAAANLPGSFRALLPTSMPAASRFDADGAPWVRRDGILLAPTARAFLEGRATASLNVSALGIYVDGLVLTGIANGSALNAVDSAITCGTPPWTQAAATSEKGWTASTGQAAYTHTTDDCVAPSRVYCLEE